MLANSHQIFIFFSAIHFTVDNSRSQLYQVPSSMKNSDHLKTWTTSTSIRANQIVNFWAAAIAPWIRVRLPSCGRGFESHAHHLCFFRFVLLKWYYEKDKNKQKKSGIGPLENTFLGPFVQIIFLVLSIGKNKIRKTKFSFLFFSDRFNFAQQ